MTIRSPLELRKPIGGNDAGTFAVPELVNSFCRLSCADGSPPSREVASRGRLSLGVPGHEVGSGSGLVKGENLRA